MLPEVPVTQTMISTTYFQHFTNNIVFNLGLAKQKLIPHSPYINNFETKHDERKGNNSNKHIANKTT
jgi:hypothetical protein